MTVNAPEELIFETRATALKKISSRRTSFRDILTKTPTLRKKRNMTHPQHHNTNLLFLSRSSCGARCKKPLQTNAPLASEQSSTCGFVSEQSTSAGIVPAQQSPAAARCGLLTSTAEQSPPNRLLIRTTEHSPRLLIVPAPAEHPPSRLLIRSKQSAAGVGRRSCSPSAEQSAAGVRRRGSSPAAEQSAAGVGRRSSSSSAEQTSASLRLLPEQAPARSSRPPGGRTGAAPAEQPAGILLLLIRRPPASKQTAGIILLSRPATKQPTSATLLLRSRQTPTCSAEATSAEQTTCSAEATSAEASSTSAESTLRRLRRAEQPASLLLLRLLALLTRRLLSQRNGDCTRGQSAAKQRRRQRGIAVGRGEIDTWKISYENVENGALLLGKDVLRQRGRCGENIKSTSSTPMLRPLPDFSWENKSPESRLLGKISLRCSDSAQPPVGPLLPLLRTAACRTASSLSSPTLKAFRRAR